MKTKQKARHRLALLLRRLGRMLDVHFHSAAAAARADETQLPVMLLLLPLPPAVPPAASRHNKHSST